MSGYSGAAGVFVISMQIIFEDKEIETAVKNGEMCISVPFEVSVISEGEGTVRCFSIFEKTAEEYLKRFENDPFSKEACDFVRKTLSEKMDGFGYEKGDTDAGHLIYYCSEKPLNNCLKSKLGEIVLISENSDFEKYELPEEMFSELDDDDEFDVCFAAVLDGRIISWAGVNDLSEDGSFEINVETVEDFRQMGLGSAVAGALVSYITSKGERVSYCFEKSNNSSRAVAEKIGLTFEKEAYSFVYYLKEN